MALGGQDIESMVAEPSANATNSKLGLDPGSLGPSDNVTLAPASWTMALMMPRRDGIEGRYSGVQMKTKSTMVLVRVGTEMKRKATEPLAAIRLEVADALRRLSYRIAADQAFSPEPKVPNAQTRKALTDVERMVGTRPIHTLRNRRPPIPLDVPWAIYWQALQECNAWWKREADFSIFPPGRSWVGVIGKLRPSMNQDWSRFDALHQKRLLGCAARDDEDWALLGNMFGTAIKPVFGDPDIRDRIETAVKRVIAADDTRFLETVTSAYASLTDLHGVKTARATRLLTLARPDRCVSLNSESEQALATYAASTPTDRSIPNSYGKLLQRIHQQPWFSRPKTGFGSRIEAEAWSMRVALLDAFIYSP